MIRSILISTSFASSTHGVCVVPLAEPTGGFVMLAFSTAFRASSAAILSSSIPGVGSGVCSRLRECVLLVLTCWSVGGVLYRLW